MKKRSLLTAVAMLIVSAIVLTSASYAWFVSGQSAQVTAVSANITVPSGLQVSAVSNSGFTSVIGPAQLAATGTNSLPAALIAASSGNIATAANASFFTGALENDGKFVATAVASDATSLAAAGIVKFTFYIKSTAAQTVNLTGSSFTGGVGAGNAVYLAVWDTTGTPELIYLNETNSNGGYNGINTAIASGTCTDTNADAIIDDTETAAANLTAVAKTGTTLASETLTFTADQTKTIVVYMWLEGQDAQCLGTTWSAASVNFNFTGTAT